MKAKLLCSIFLFTILSSCNAPTYLFTTPKQTGVDFTSGKWILNELDAPKNSKDELTETVSNFFKKNLNDRFFYIHDVNGLLVPRKIPLNPSKTKLKELKDGTGFDFFINISTKKNQSDFSSIELYQSESEGGKNEASVIVEIYDLNLQQIIYSQNVVGVARKKSSESVWQTEKSNKLIDNVTFYKNSNQLMNGALKKILKDIDKKSVK
ncbi:hypothetical protein BD847_3546 [Flavobacterium cutihirudinis]|uniref:Lipoprotein n=1 Tax=Flavobacterium cutihirudinis TaxID=1265740 RepID=A0A3D9FP83_9FLAO|nr:hypothetical protein [Flavobacterium cutihirudinis]RED22049.1 hypothetical protein BD847_3546 [Flavobacterium cutihirudinis]